MATLATLVVNLTANAGEFFSEMEKAESSTSKILGSMGSNVQSLGNVALAGLGVLTGAATAAGAGLAKLAVDAAPIEGIQKSFEGLTESIGVGANEMLAALEKGSAGMISQTDLMTSFNKAAGLVSTDFAVQLPEAMQYLAKVAAATGQDMDYMLNSLVTGVGRLSPMILDNLGIQVSLAEATARAAEMFGVEEGALTKTQIQAGMMSEVLEKLQANTAAMPDVAGSAAAGLAQMEARFQNLKDQLGLALLPALNTVLGTLGTLTDAVLPPLVAFFEGSVVPAVEKVTQFIDTFVSSIVAGQGPVEALQQALQSIGLDQIAEAIGTVAGKVGELWATVEPYMTMVASWIGQNVELQDVLIALGIAIGSVVIPAVVSLLTAVAPIAATAAALVAAVALMRTAWENDWLGIREIVGAVADFISGTVWPAIQTALDFLRNNVIPPLQTAIETLWNRALEFWNGFWNAFQPSLQRMYERLGEFWADIQPKLMEAWQALQRLWTTVEQLWTGTLKPALDRLTEALGLGGEETSKFGETVGALAGLLLEIELEGLINMIALAIDAMVAAVEAVASAMEWWQGVIESVKNALAGLSIPDWLSPGSRTPLEIGIRGISEAMRDLNVSGLSFRGGGDTVILAPVFLDPREYTMAGGEIDYAAVGRRLRELQGGI